MATGGIVCCGSTCLAREGGVAFVLEDVSESASEGFQFQGHFVRHSIPISAKLAYVILQQESILIVSFQIILLLKSSEVQGGMKKRPAHEEVRSGSKTLPAQKKSGHQPRK